MTRVNLIRFKFCMCSGITTHCNLLHAYTLNGLYIFYTHAEHRQTSYIASPVLHLLIILFRAHFFIGV